MFFSWTLQPTPLQVLPRTRTTTNVKSTIYYNDSNVNYRTEDIYANIKTFHSQPPPPIYNMRHIHPVRQSGPIPPYDGPWTMEDIKKLYGDMRVPWDHTA